MDGEPPGCQGLDARGGGDCPLGVGHRTFRMGSTIAGGEVIDRNNSKQSRPGHRHRTRRTGSRCTRHDTDTQLEEPAPASHAAGAEVDRLTACVFKTSSKRKHLLVLCVGAVRTLLFYIETCVSTQHALLLSTK
ncbi:unnamed protein product, partial [Ectocarpus sp. 12 AP-2014]